MRISIITLDQVIVLDSTPAMMLEVGGFEMAGGEWAVHFDTNTGIGHVEYTDSRPNKVISQADFDASYSWCLARHSEWVDFDAARNAIPEV